jgi:hypothetical protein
MNRRVLGILVYVGLFGQILHCGSPRTNVRNVASIVQPATLTDASVDSAVQANTDHVVLLPQIAALRVVDTQGQNIFATYGSLRVTKTNGQWQVATDRFASRIVLATHVNNGWVFVSADGAVAQSDEFLGALHRIGNITQSLTRQGVSRGQAAVCDDAGTLWMTDGTVPIHPVGNIPNNGRVRAVTFVNAQFGAIIINEGSFYTTHDELKDNLLSLQTIHSHLLTTAIQLQMNR